MKEELEKIMKWKSVSSGQINELYKVYYDLYDDKRNHCKKCPAVIRRIFDKVKKYYKDNYEK